MLKQRYINVTIIMIKDNAISYHIWPVRVNSIYQTVANTYVATLSMILCYSMVKHGT